ncbi:GNAT family N-acetyltransferase [Halobacillus shinanisalinarum]|uniref:GNAT family N-acetyltransferase n=1 Tax=Halobacillus shinanisalinarum TaxID=2932258 RepID=A0ABY4GWS0_9BACI|nr:GNAT family protein [Halobacillus shinanisalinarum]UOQ92165.1 GNAT family N-acetyltransferase [Halobacillus shinanisalinarum]
MFSSNRIHFRKVTEDDAAIYHRWRNDPEVMENTSPNLDVYTFEETEEFIRSITASYDSKCYMIELNDKNTPIDIVSLIHTDYENRNAECIIDIGDKDYWGNGFGQEAMQLLLHYSFSEVNLHKVYLKVFSFNYRAIKLYERLGFVKEGELKEHLFRNGRWYGITLMAILQKEYFS